MRHGVGLTRRRCAEKKRNRSESRTKWSSHFFELSWWNVEKEGKEERRRLMASVETSVTSATKPSVPNATNRFTDYLPINSPLLSHIGPFFRQIHSIPCPVTRIYGVPTYHLREIILYYLCS
ncbi:hypothetical protein K0M31_016197 [Melipona bicolor]|uniref:Uncharacterized protein n=1 Tax=Melipona bicolor TaxID=60889 RepID=A0AA40KT98_9HYME|nr:hypothetical protein K0M31_016197 [Melipona bicolor]